MLFVTGLLESYSGTHRLSESLPVTENLAVAISWITIMNSRYFRSLVLVPACIATLCIFKLAFIASVP